MKSVKKIKKICPKLKTAYLISEKFYKLRIKNLIFYKMVSNKCSFANPSFVLIDKQFIKKCHGRDLEVLSYTVNNIENYQKLSNLKCDEYSLTILTFFLLLISKFDIYQLFIDFS